MTVLSDIHELYGFARSWMIYRGPFWRRERMARLYSRFVAPDSLCFDLGAHVGNRVSVWRALGARVVAVEPQSLFARYLERFVADDAVHVVECAVGREPGQARLYSDPRNPTVSTLNRQWQEQLGGKPGWKRVRWSAQRAVDVLTLDGLIERFGEPVFCKIDVEGAELDVLLGLTRPLASLSFEVVPGVREMGLAVLDRLAELGEYRFNFSRAESMVFQFDADRDTDTLRRFIRHLPAGAPSGDIYACRVD